jgi:hypothetical protein
MASINLAGAIGLGGKRESIISGLPDAINKAGDALNKTIGDELKRQEAERAAKRAKEEELKAMFQKQVQSTIGDYDVHPEDKKKLTDEGINAITKGYMIANDPNMSYAEKQLEQQKILRDLGERSSTYHQDWKAHKAYTKFVGDNEGIVEKEAADRFLVGDYGKTKESPYILESSEGKMMPPEEKLIETKTNYPNQQGKNYFELSYEDRKKVAPNGLTDALDERVFMRKGDEKKAFEDFVGSPLGAFTQKLNIDGKDKFVFQQDKFDFQKKALEQSLEDGKGIGKEIGLVYRSIAEGYYKKLVNDENYPKNEAAIIAKNYAKEVMIDKFEKSVEAAKLDRMKDQDLTAAKGGDGKDGGSKSSIKMADTHGKMIGDATNVENKKRAKDIRKKADEREKTLKVTEARLKAAGSTSKESIANIESTKKSIEIMRQSADVLDNTENVQDYVMFSWQKDTDDKELTFAGDDGKPVLMKPLMAYRDKKGNVRLGGIYKKTKTDENTGDRITEEVIVNVPLDDNNYSTMKVNKTNFENEYKKTKFANKSVSLQSGSEKKAEGKSVDAESIHQKYDIASYATAPNHEKVVDNVYKEIKKKVEYDEESIDKYIQSKANGSPITGQMVIKSAEYYGVEPQALLALIQVDSSFATKGKAVRTKNAGNVGNDDAGNEVTFRTWQEGIDAVAKQLKKRETKKAEAPKKVDAKKENLRKKYNY